MNRSTTDKICTHKTYYNYQSHSHIQIMKLAKRGDMYDCPKFLVVSSHIMLILYALHLVLLTHYSINIVHFKK